MRSIAFGTSWIVALAVAATLAAAPGDLRLVEAARSGDRAAVRALLKQGVDVNAPQGDGATALHWAAHNDDLEMAEALLRAGAAANATNGLGVAPLWLACLNGSAAMVERLLTAGANANVTLPSGETALMTASRTGNVDAVKLLLAHGADVNARERSRGQTALMWAVGQGHASIVRALIEARADVHVRSDVRPRRINTETTGFGNEILGDIEQGGFTPLLFAARQGSVDIARQLLAAGATVKDTSPEGTSALVVAVHSGHAALAGFFLENGADPNAAGAGYTALHAAIMRGYPDLVKQLLARGADPNALLVKGTPVRRASADYGISGEYVGANPAWLAARFAEPDIMRTLLASGANPANVLKDGTTMLMAAVAGTRRAEPGIVVDNAAIERLVLEDVQLAVTAGNDVNASDKDGNTALHTAASRKLNTVIRYLVEKGARLDVKNRKDVTPLAAAGTDNSTAQLLRELGAR